MPRRRCTFYLSNNREGKTMITRRDFLKVTGVAAAAAALTACGGSSSTASSAASSTAASSEAASAVAKLDKLHRLLQTSASEVAFDNRKPFCRHRIQYTNFDRFLDKQNRLHLPPFESHSWDKRSYTPRSRSNPFYRQIKRSNS